MSDQNNAFMLRWYNEVWNNSNERAIDEMFHPDGKAHGLGAEPLVGPQEFKAFYKKFNDMLSDIKVSVDRTLMDEDYVTAMCTVQATHRETNKPISFTGVSIAKVVNDQIVEGWNYFDFLTFNLQIGKITPEQLL